MWDASIKPQESGTGGFRAGEHIHRGRGQVTHPSFMGTEAPVLRTLPELALCTSSSSCSPLAFIASFNKPGTVSKCFPESRESWSLTSRTQARGGGNLGSQVRGQRHGWSVLGLGWIWRKEGAASRDLHVDIQQVSQICFLWGVGGYKTPPPTWGPGVSEELGFPLHFCKTSFQPP